VTRSAATEPRRGLEAPVPDQRVVGSVHGGYRIDSTILRLRPVVEAAPVTLVDDDGNSYRLAGAVRFGATDNAQQETGQETFAAYLNILAAGGGVVDTVAQIGHFDFTGDGFLFDNGSCVLPD